MGQSTKFSPPLPVSDLRISQVGKNIRLDWKGVQSPSLYGYYVYRGTSAEAMIQLDGVVRNATSYIDSSDVLSGRRQYFYSVMTMNLTQDTSDHVPPVAMRPLRPISTTYPKVIDAALINGTVWLSWHDVRLDDNILDRFVLQRKEAKAGTFRSIIDKNTAFTQPSFIDTTSQAGQSRWYRVAAVTVFGDTTEFSQVTEITLPTSAPEPVFTFYVRNITSGIEVSWPVTTTDARTKYAIYRRPAESETFARIGEVNSQTSLFLDTKVVGGKKYVYSVTSVETNGRESNRVKNLAVIRE